MVRVWVPWAGEAKPSGARLTELARTEEAARETAVVLAVFGFARDTPTTAAAQARFCTYANGGAQARPERARDRDLERGELAHVLEWNTRRSTSPCLRAATTQCIGAD